MVNNPSEQLQSRSLEIGILQKLFWGISSSPQQSEVSQDVETGMWISGFHFNFERGMPTTSLSGAANPDRSIANPTQAIPPLDHSNRASLTSPSRGGLHHSPAAFLPPRTTTFSSTVAEETIIASGARTSSNSTDCIWTPCDTANLVSVEHETNLQSLTSTPPQNGSPGPKSSLSNFFLEYVRPIKDRRLFCEGPARLYSLSISSTTSTPIRLFFPEIFGYRFACDKSVNSQPLAMAMAMAEEDEEHGSSELKSRRAWVSGRRWGFGNDSWRGVKR